MQSINLQITPSGVMPVVNASQYDYGRLVQFNLYDGASAYIPPEGTEIRVEGRKSDGTVFSYFANYVGNAVIVTLTQQMTVLAEDVPCELRLNVNNEDIGTINFTLAVEPSNIGMAVVSETEIPAIISLARRQELNSEAWANGTRNGVPVSPDDPAYENNAKYWAEHADLGTLENLLDVNVEDLTDGQIIKYNSETGKWENADEEGGGASNLGDLSDVTITSPSNKQVLMFNYLQQKWENGDAPSGGMTSHIIVESEAGESSVTVTLPSGTVKTCTQVSGSTTQWETTSDEYGTHIIDAYKDGDDAQAQLNIQYVGEYLVHDEHYFHTINVTVKAGASIVITGNGETYGGTGTGSAVAFAVHGKEITYTVTTSIDGVSAASQTVTTPATSGQSTSLTFTYGTINLTYSNDFRGVSLTCSDGNKTITKTAPSGANIMSFYPPNTGTWIISGTVSGQPYSTEAIVVDLAVAVTANIQTVPDGSTVTPTDDIQTWLHCAGIYDKNYTTLSEVLTDSTTLATLIADNNATDYLVRSTTWATDLCADSTAMTYIGLNNYASNTLLADSDWLTAICNSQYFESVLNVKVPQMTDNTHPSGIASNSDNSSSAYKGLGVYAEDPNYANLENNQNAKIMYEFPDTVTIYKIYMHLRNGSSLSRSFTYKASGSTDGSTWNDMFSGIAWNDSGNGDTTNTVIATNPITAKHFAGDCYIGTKDGSNKYSVRMKVQFYGRIDV